MSAQSKTAEIRARLGHPVIDSDGHFIEYLPAVSEYIVKAGGRKALDDFGAAFSKTFLSTQWHDLTPSERR